MRNRPLPIRLARISAGIYLREISERTGISPPRLSEIERAIIRPTREEVSSILDALSAEGVEVGALEEARRFLRSIAPLDGGSDPRDPEAA